VRPTCISIFFGKQTTCISNHTNMHEVSIRYNESSVTNFSQFCKFLMCECGLFLILLFSFWCGDRIYTFSPTNLRKVVRYHAGHLKNPINFAQVFNCERRRICGYVVAAGARRLDRLYWSSLLVGKRISCFKLTITENYFLQVVFERKKEMFDQPISFVTT
jgi:hypothetical protein